ncbi:MAG: hypothetical protein ACI85K_002807 [Hyphomicrobiaceae bacterium]|jgi:hypothetical protein
MPSSWLYVLPGGQALARASPLHVTVIAATGYKLAVSANSAEPVRIEMASSESSMTNEQSSVSAEFTDQWPGSKSAISLSARNQAVRPRAGRCEAAR